MKFTVKSPLDHNNKSYPIGSTVELTEEEAAQVRDAVEPVAAEGKKGKGGKGGGADNAAAGADAGAAADTTGHE